MGIQFWLQVVPVAALLVFGFSVGGIVERAHFRRLRAREEAARDMLLTDVGPRALSGKIESFGLVTGEVVIASDYFKTFVATLRKLVGGDLRTYETLMERARREAILRMLESARSLGADRVANVRLASSNIGSGGGGRGRGKAAMVEMHAYGTALRVL